MIRIVVGERNRRKQHGREGAACAGGWRRGVRRVEGRPEEKQRQKEKVVGLVPEAGTSTFCASGNPRYALGRAKI